MDIDEEEDCIKYVTALWFWSMALTSKVFTLWHRYTIYKKKKLFRHKNGSLDCMDSVDKIIADRNYFDKILSIGNLNIYSSKNDQFHENSFYPHHSSLFKSEDNLFNLFHVTFNYDESEIDVKDDGKINENYTKTLNSIDMHERTDATSNNSSHGDGKVEESKEDDVISVDGSIERRDVRKQKSQPEESRCPAGHHESDGAEIDDFDKDDKENCNNDVVDGEEDCHDDNDANRCADTIRNEQEESHYLDTSDQNEISNDDDSHCSDHDNDGDDNSADENDDIGFINNSNQANTGLINITKENDASDDDNVDDIESSDDDDDDAISKEETSDAKSSVASQLGGPILSTSMSFVDRQSNELIERNNVGSLTNSCVEQDVTQDVNNSDLNESDVTRDEPIVRSTTQDNFTQTDCSSLLTFPSDPRSRSTRPSSETSSRNVHRLDIDSIQLLPPIFFCTKPNHDDDDDDESDCPNKMFRLRVNRRHAGPNHLGGIVQDEMFHAKTFGRPSLEDKRFSIIKTLLDENIKKIVQASVAARHHHHHHVDYVVECHDGLDDHPANNNTSCNHHGDGNRLTGLINKTERPVTNYLNDPFPLAMLDRCGGSFNGGSDDDYIETDDCREELENIRDQLRRFQELKNKLKNALETKKEMIEIINNKSFDTTSLNIQSFLKTINKEISELTVLYHRNLPSSIQLAKRAEYLISKFDIR